MRTNDRQNFIYLAQMKQRYPDLYAQAVQKTIGRMTRSNQMNGLGASANYGTLTAEQVVALQNAEFANVPYAAPVQAGTWDWLSSAAQTTTDFLKDNIATYLGIQQAKTCLDINKQRALQNLPPIDCSSAGLTPQVNVGVSKEIQTLAFAALGIGAIYLFTRRGK